MCGAKWAWIILTTQRICHFEYRLCMSIVFYSSANDDAAVLICRSVKLMKVIFSLGVMVWNLSASSILIKKMSPVLWNN